MKVHKRLDTLQARSLEQGSSLTRITRMQLYKLDAHASCQEALKSSRQKRLRSSSLVRLRSRLRGRQKKSHSTNRASPRASNVRPGSQVASWKKMKANRASIVEAALYRHEAVRLASKRMKWLSEMPLSPS